MKPAIKKALDAMRSDAFQRMGQQLEHHERVTLYREASFCWQAIRHFRWPLGTWLVPFARSGPDGRTFACFKIPRDRDQAEGVVGTAFARDMTIRALNLPDVTKSNVGESALLDYAGKAFIDVEWVRKKRPKSRAILGIPVRVKGKVWGALVVDSRNPEIKDTERVIKSVQMGATLLAILMERS